MNSSLFSFLGKKSSPPKPNPEPTPAYYVWKDQSELSSNILGIKLYAGGRLMDEFLEEHSITPYQLKSTLTPAQLDIVKQAKLDFDAAVKDDPTQASQLTPSIESKECFLKIWTENPHAEGWCRMADSPSLDTVTIVDGCVNAKHPELGPLPYVPPNQMTAMFESLWPSYVGRSDNFLVELGRRGVGDFKVFFGMWKDKNKKDWMPKNKAPYSDSIPPRGLKQPPSTYVGNIPPPASTQPPPTPIGKLLQDFGIEVPEGCTEEFALRLHFEEKERLDSNVKSERKSRQNMEVALGKVSTAAENSAAAARLNAETNQHLVAGTPLRNTAPRGVDTPRLPESDESPGFVTPATAWSATSRRRTTARPPTPIHRSPLRDSGDDSDEEPLLPGIVWVTHNVTGLQYKSGRNKDGNLCGFCKNKQDLCKKCFDRAHASVENES